MICSPTYLQNEKAKSELMHYGVLGMKWGVRKEYEPVGRKPASSVKPKSRHRTKLEEKFLSKGMSQEDAEKAAAKRIRIEKIIAISAGVTLVAAAAYVASQNIALQKYDRNTMESLKYTFDTARNNGTMSITDIPRVEKSPDLFADLKEINPRYGSKVSVKDVLAGKASPTVWETNCGFCSTAFEMRRRGFNVEAISNGTGMNSLTVNRMFKDPQWAISTPRSAYDTIAKKGLAWGDGARGLVHVGWKNGGGHAFSFEIKDGLPLFVDPQNNASSAEKYFTMAKSVIFTRLDNLELKDNILDAVKIKNGVL